jgi:hypothetical protein
MKPRQRAREIVAKLEAGTNVGFHELKLDFEDPSPREFLRVLLEGEINDALRDYENWQTKIYRSEPLGAGVSLERYLNEQDATDETP